MLLLHSSVSLLEDINALVSSDGPGSPGARQRCLKPWSDAMRATADKECQQLCGGDSAHRPILFLQLDAVTREVVAVHDGCRARTC